jgi:hypothetical protein
MSNTTPITQGRRAKAKTWSRFGNLGRKPNEYEIVTHDMNHTMTGVTPLEMGPDVHGNVWLRKFRDSMPLKVADWNGFRDPDRVTYRKYNTMQDQQETYVEGLLAEFTTKDADQALSPAAVALLGKVMTPCRYLGHGQQMLTAYVQQLAPSSYIANCAAFQTADQLRRVQLVAYRTKQLDLSYPDAGFGGGERAVWEGDAGWQKLRECIERLMVAFDWHTAYVGLQLVLKPLADQLTLRELAGILRGHGDNFDALILENLYLDAERSRRWTVACTQFLIGSGEGNREALLQTLAEWRKFGDEIITAGAEMLAAHAAPDQPDHSAQAIATRLRDDWTQLLTQAGLGADG